MRRGTRPHPLTQRAVQAKPDWAEAHYKLAKAYDAQEDPANAYQEYTRTADLDPSNIDGQVHAGTLLLAAGEFESARTRAELALKAAPDSAPANILLGNALAAQYTLGLTAIARQDSATAEQAFQNALKLNPRASAPRLQPARLQLARGETAGALQAAEEVSRQRPDDVEAAVLMSRSLRAQGDLPRAERELATQILRNPASAPLHVEMGWVALQRNQARGNLSKKRCVSSRPRTMRWLAS